MTNGLTYFVAAAIVAAVAADGVLNGWQGSLFLARKFLDLLSLVTFWR